MDITRPFLDYLRKFVDLTDEEYQHYILPYIKVRRFGKKEVVTKANEVENYFNFVLRGMARKYYKKGKTKSIHRFHSKTISYTHRSHIIVAHLQSIM